jgi:ABC-2 type transport system permease protein
MTAFLALLRKDLLLFLQDRRALLLNLLAPILIAGFFGFLFGGSGDSKPSRLPVAISDGDRSPLSQKIVAGLQADEALAVQILEPEPAAELVRKGKLHAAVQLPPGFGEQAGRALFGGGAKPELVVIHDPSQAIALGLLRGLLTQHAMQVISQDAFSAQGRTFVDLRERALTDPQLPEAQRADLAAMFDSIARVQQAQPAPGAASSPVARGLSQPFSLRAVEALPAQRQGGYNAYSHAFAGMGVQFILMLGIEFGVGLLLMRRQDLWKRLRAAPLSRTTLLGSRLASGALIAFVLFAAILGAGMLIFGVRVLGSWLGLILLLAAFALLTASFGLLIAAIGRTPEATRGLAIMATLMMVMLGGAWVPAFLFPDWLQTASLAVPTRWAVDGIDAMTWRGLDLTDALPAAGALLAFSALFALIALWRFRWEE